MRELLEQFGLTVLETKIYLALLNSGAMSAGEISEKTAIHRRNVYDALERLIQKGLAAYIKENNSKVFSITNPENLQVKLKQQQAELETLMPELSSKFHAITEKKETLFFRGKAGLRQIFEDQIREGEEILVNATSVSVASILKHFFPKYQQLRKEKKIPTRMIFDRSFKNKRDFQNIKKLPLCRAKFVRDFNRSPMSQYIYGSSVAIVVWSSSPVAILIKQKEIAQGFRESFELVWKLAEK